MGDRGNIVMRLGKTQADDVWFYTHWSGYEIKSVVQKALAMNERHNDGMYLARIVFDKLTDGAGGTTGFGISTSIGDNEHDIVVVDVPAKTVFTVKEENLIDGRIPLPEEAMKNAVAKWSFTDFVKAKFD
jgi:hypothetical protein